MSLDRSQLVNTARSGLAGLGQGQLGVPLLRVCAYDLRPLNMTSNKQVLSRGNNIIAIKALVREEPQTITDKTIVGGAFTAASTFALDYP